MGSECLLTFTLKLSLTFFFFFLREQTTLISVCLSYEAVFILLHKSMGQSFPGDRMKQNHMGSHTIPFLSQLLHNKIDLFLVLLIFSYNFVQFPWDFFPPLLLMQLLIFFC